MWLIGGYGLGILFFCAMVGVIIVGLFYLAYAAQCLFVVLESTGAGSDKVVWPDEPMFDWLGKLGYLVVLLICCFTPVWLFVEVFLGELLGLSVPPTYAVFLGVLWLLYPVCLLSSLSSEHHWMLLRPTILRQLLRHPGAMAIFYGMTGVLLLAAFGLAYVALDRRPLLIPVAAMALATVPLLHARLLGRIAWLISSPSNNKKPKRKKKKRQTPEETAAAEDLAGDVLLGREPEVVREDTALPALELAPEPEAPPVQAPVDDSPLPVPEDLDVSSTSFKPAEETRPRRAHASHSSDVARVPAPGVPHDVDEIGLVPLPENSLQRVDEDEWLPAAPYAMNTATPPRPPEPPAQLKAPTLPSYDLQAAAPRMPAPIPLDGYSPIGLEPWRPQADEADANGQVPSHPSSPINYFEERLARRQAPPPRPAHPLWSGVYQFPWYDTSVKRWINLALVSLVLFGFLYVFVLTWPVERPW
jgi:hypothetical protein